MVPSVEDVLAALINDLLSRNLISAATVERITQWDIGWASLIAEEEK